jgi:hypothetical protein
MANVTTTTAAVFLPTLWSVETLRAAENALVAAGLVKRYDALVKAKGQAIKIPNISNLSANAKVANTSVTTQAITETSVTLNIDKWYESSFEIEDMVTVQSNYDLRSEYSEKAGYAIAKQVDTDLLSLYTGFTTTDVGTYGTDLGDAAYVQALLAVNLNDVPLENRAFVIAPTQLAAIMKIDKFVKADFLGQYDQATPVKKGPNSRYLWGEIYGTPVYYTNNVQTSAGTPTQYHNILLHKEAWALALQQAPRLQAAYWLPDLAWKVVVDAIYGVVTLRGGFGVELRS